MVPPLPSLGQMSESKSRLNFLLQPNGDAPQHHLRSPSGAPSTRLEALSLAEPTNSSVSPCSSGPAVMHRGSTRLPSLAAAYPLPPLPPTQTRARSADSAMVGAHGLHSFGHTAGAGMASASHDISGAMGSMYGGGSGDNNIMEMGGGEDDVKVFAHHSLSEPPMAGNRRPPTADSGFSDVTVAGHGMRPDSGSISSGPSLSSLRGMSTGGVIGSGREGLVGGGRGLRRGFGSGSSVKSEAELRDKREMRRMKNRISAARSRQRKTDTFETLQRELAEAKTVIEALTRQLDRAHGGREQSGIGGAEALGPPPPPSVIAVPQDLRPVVGRDFVSADGLMDMLRAYIRRSNCG